MSKRKNMSNDPASRQFFDWIRLKIHLQKVGRMPRIKEGEVWWAAVGKNVGVEINGKTEHFSRPVLVFKKLSQHYFMAIPLTSKEHDGSWYVPIKLNGKVSRAVLSQSRSMSVNRLFSRIGALPSHELEKIQSGFKKLFVSE